MRYKFLLKFILFPLGLALLLTAALFQEGIALPPAAPTPDRLAQPTMPAIPTQADQGAQLYWLSCLPCHGDRGQGLTDEFRQAYPQEDQNCWLSGCHGNRPYQDGFTIPKYIPPVIGPGTLQKFSNAAVLRSYIFAAMPYWNPGSLTEEETWQVTAFLLRENGLWDAKEDLTASNADQVPVGPPQPTPTPQPDPAIVSETYLPVTVALVVLIVLLLVFGIIRRNRTQ